jgi:AAHS family 3-hydroxyphenylpropionic acid transporter
MASDQALEPINVATSGIERVHFQRFCIRLLGLGGAMPNLIAMAAETSAPGIRNRSVGIAYIGMPIGGSLASVLAFFIPSESWRELFRVGGLAPLLLVPALMYFLPDKRSAATSRSQALGFADSAQQLLAGC